MIIFGEEPFVLDDMKVKDPDGEKNSNIKEQMWSIDFKIIQSDFN